MQSSIQSKVEEKLRRYQSGLDLRVLDLFAGCGGISLGFEAAGFTISAAVEFDPIAAESHAAAFHSGESEHAKARDITKLDASDLVEDLGLGSADEAFDIVVGGPPCQAYARVGRAKLREVAEHPEAFRVDPRASLFLRYLAWIEETAPIAVMMENVPDVLNHAGHNIADEVCEALEAMGYDCKYSLLNAAHYGVPQMRDRVFLIGVHRVANSEICFPAASNYHDLPVGYAGTRAVALKHVDQKGGRWVAPDLGSKDLPGPITSADALSDLKPITLHLEGKLKRGARRFTEGQGYRSRPKTDYQRLMRCWEGHESPGEVFDHVIRYLPRDTEIFRHMPEGGEYPAAHAVAVELFEKEAVLRGLSRDSADWVELYKKMVPPYPVHTFPNRWGKLRKRGPARTLMAHLGKDCYSHIHYDDDQARTISVREAARLQGFPDGFRFSGTMNPAFRQIGNAVPPLLARAVAVEMKRSIDSSKLVGTTATAAE
ncbi:DNA cytosine methyltransferase [uncultured Tateyamaria sp.]|uniref:DNA cytosine methyltransferase n=1 Tax=uncultured Tateyamaria sp. TaxID=455651 RepID=UPI002637FAB0|nr:DNA cytosine methyltransferase [uncultured Tateyamaria sp.]